MTKFVKSIAGLMTVAMVLSAVVVPVSASAQTVADLQAMIATLQAQIAALSGQTGGSTGYTFTTNLQVGSRSEAVRQLQMVLNSDPDTMVALTGVGSAGNETTYYGILTKKAVAKFQAKHGISPTSGIVGPLTRAQLNSMNTTPTPGPVIGPVMDGTDGSLSASISSYAGNTTIKNCS
jgi:peptidoglycan hydrolase-like protein with peptidoglycan-binding domain